MTEWEQYIGLPWEAGAQGPDAFDCMGLAGHIQRKHFGIDVPMFIVPDVDDTPFLVELMQGHTERSNWIPVSTPRHGDMVLVHRPLHYGVYLDVDGGGILHCARRCGVVFTRLASWPTSGFGRKEYFRHKERL